MNVREPVLRYLRENLRQQKPLCGVIADKMAGCSPEWPMARSAMIQRCPTARSHPIHSRSRSHQPVRRLEASFIA